MLWKTPFWTAKHVTTCNTTGAKSWVVFGQQLVCALEDSLEKRRGKGVYPKKRKRKKMVRRWSIVLYLQWCDATSSHGQGPIFLSFRHAEITVPMVCSNILCWFRVWTNFLFFGRRGRDTQYTILYKCHTSHEKDTFARRNGTIRNAANQAGVRSLTVLCTQDRMQCNSHETGTKAVLSFLSHPGAK